MVRKDRKSTRLNSSHVEISYAVFCLKKKTLRGIEGDGTTTPTYTPHVTITSRAVAPLPGRPGRSYSHFPVLTPKGGGHFFFNDTATTEIYTLSLHDALPI